MKLTVDGETFEFDVERMTNVEGMAIEKATGLLFAEWGEALQKGSMVAQTALVWVVKKRHEPTLRFEDVSYELASIDLEDEGEEDAAPKADAANASVTTD